jgi:SAM-dependent methyltransferase
MRPVMSVGVGRWLERGASEVVVQILARLRKSGMRTVLDIPSGRGPVRRQVEAMGYTVVEIDLMPHRGMHGVVADACAPLPLRDAILDCVLSMEGIEHFENQTGFLRECARVLRPGGALVATTPNVNHLAARLAAFLTGQRSLHQGLLNETSTVRARSGPRIYHGHAYLIDAFRLRYVLRVVGLEVEQIGATGLSLGSIWLAPLAPLIGLATLFALRRGRRRQLRYERPTPSRALETALRRLALSPALLFGKKVVVVARKPAETGLSSPQEWPAPGAAPSVSAAGKNARGCTGSARAGGHGPR